MPSWKWWAVSNLVRVVGVIVGWDTFVFLSDNSQDASSSGSGVVLGALFCWILWKFAHRLSKR